MSAARLPPADKFSTLLTRVQANDPTLVKLSIGAIHSDLDLVLTGEQLQFLCNALSSNTHIVDLQLWVQRVGLNVTGVR